MKKMMMVLVFSVMVTCLNSANAEEMKIDFLEPPTQEELIEMGYDKTFNAATEKRLWGVNASLSGDISSPEKYEFYQGISCWLPGMSSPEGVIFFFRTTRQGDETDEAAIARLKKIVEWFGAFSFKSSPEVGADIWIDGDQISLAVFSF